MAMRRLLAAAGAFAERLIAWLMEGYCAGIFDDDCALAAAFAGCFEHMRRFVSCLRFIYFISFTRVWRDDLICRF